MMPTRAAITALGGYVPDYVLTNAELETIVDTSDEWIMSRTGIKERRILKGEGVGTSFMAIKAVEQLMQKSGLKATDIDLLICATTSPDMVFPATANVICHSIGAVNAWGYDISAACSGFMFALATASRMIESGAYKKVVVVGGDKMSSMINYTDRTTCIIFGDGCGAVLLEPDNTGLGIIDSIMRADGSGVPYLYQKAGGSVRPASHETIDNNEHSVHQEGQQVFKFAVTNMAQVAGDIMEKNNLVAEDIAWLVPHQANKRIIDATANRMGIGPDKVMINIHKYGNTTNGTIPLCLWDWESQLKKGDNIILASFGGGFTWGSVYLKWAY